MSIRQQLCEIVKREHPITVRGVFYRAVSAGLFPGTQLEYYRKCGNLLQQLRRLTPPLKPKSGMTIPWIPYDWIIDSSRTRHSSRGFSGPKEFIETMITGYSRNYWLDQAVHLEVMSEKDAMATILQPIIRRWNVPFTVFRGNPSDTLCYRIGTLFKADRDEDDLDFLEEDEKGQQQDEDDKPVVILYLGDHDPSGINISKVAQEKIERFAHRKIEWRRVAVTYGQFEEMQEQLSIPTKPKDKLGPTYRAMYGDVCVEVDAIPSDEVRELLNDSILEWIDMDQWKASEAKEKEEEKQIETLVQEIEKQFK